MSKKITEPKLRFVTKQSTIELWVLDAGEYCELAAHHSFHYHAGKTGSLIYVHKDVNSFQATEYDLHNASTWGWIAEWMTKGLQVRGARLSQAIRR